MRRRAKGLFHNPFAAFVAKKVVFYAVVAFVAMTFVFFITHLMPGNPVDRMIASLSSTGGQGSGTNYLILKAKLMEYFGLDKPLFDQYINFWRELFTLNLGPSYPINYPQSVLSIVMLRLPYTLAIVVPVLLLSFFLGNWIGAKAAYVGGKRSELAYFFSVFSNRLPSFWFGMVLIFVFAAVLKVFPSHGLATMGTIPSWNLSFFLDVLQHYSLPFLTLFIIYVGGWATGMRSMVIHEMDSGYVRYGEQLGFRKSKLMSYAERNAILPQVTGLNLQFNALIGETAILEIIFGWPGIGKMMFDAVGADDYMLIFGGFMVIMVVVILGNFLIDILYGFIDPRIRAGGGQ